MQPLALANIRMSRLDGLPYFRKYGASLDRLAQDLNYDAI